MPPCATTPGGRIGRGRRGRCARVTRSSGRTLPSAVPPPGWGTTGSATHTHRRGSGSELRSSWVGCRLLVNCSMDGGRLPPWWLRTSPRSPCSRGWGRTPQRSSGRSGRGSCPPGCPGQPARLPTRSHPPGCRHRPRSCSGPTGSDPPGSGWRPCRWGSPKLRRSARCR